MNHSTNTQSTGRAHDVTPTQLRALLAMELRRLRDGWNAGTLTAEDMKARRGVALVYGPSGGGKTMNGEQAVRDVFGDVSVYPDVSATTVLYDLRFGSFEAIDTRGGLNMNAGTGRTDWLPPSWLPNADANPHIENHVILCDEITNGQPEVATQFLGFVRDGRLGEYALPTHRCAVIAMGNEVEDTNVYNETPTPFRARFGLVVRNVPQLNDTLEYFARRGVHGSIIGFLAYAPEYFMSRPDAESYVRLDPRRWAEVVSPDVFAFESGELAGELKAGGLTFLDLCMSKLGTDAGSKFAAYFLMHRDLPSYASIVRDPSNVAVPDTAGARHAVCAMIARLATPQDFDASGGWILAANAAGTMPDEYTMFAFRIATTRDAELKETRVYNQFAERFTSALQYA